MNRPDRGALPDGASLIMPTYLVNGFVGWINGVPSGIDAPKIQGVNLKLHKPLQYMGHTHSLLIASMYSMLNPLYDLELRSIFNGLDELAAIHWTSI